MPHALRVALLVCLFLPAPAIAATQRYVFSGWIETVTDVDDFLDTTVKESQPGSGIYELVSGNYDVDLDTNGDTTTPFDITFAQLVFGVGRYGFNQTQDLLPGGTPDDSPSIALINHTGPLGSEIDLWQTSVFRVTDLEGGTSPSGNFAGFQARLEFFVNDTAVDPEFTGTESAPIVPDDIVGWTQARLLLESLKDNGDGTTSFDGRVQVQVNLTSWGVQPIPEPQSSALVALGLVSLALRARRRARVR